MLRFDEARTRVLADVRRVSAERVPLPAALSRVLAAPVVAAAPWPLFDYSAMDGYALASADVSGSGPWSLAIDGEARAGATPLALTPRTARRIFTGAPIPAGADVVVMQEVARVEGDRVVFEARPRSGQHIRRAGEDVAAGATALEPGLRLTPGALALASMLDQPEVVVARRPQVTILCTGDELRRAGAADAPGRIPESNSAALAALAAQAGASVRVAPMVADDPAATAAAIEGALEGADLLLTIGGVSVGDHDVVRPALERAGVRLQFWKVAIKPGKPLAVGRSAAAHVLGLPGNPASAIVTFVVFGMPLLRAMQGDARPLPATLPACLESARKRSPDRLELARASLRREGSRIQAAIHDNQASGAATSLARSDGLAFLPPGEDALEGGTVVDFLRWSDA